MNVLYVASDQVVPGTTGGSVHVLEVARGLARRGHQVDVVVQDGKGAARPESTGVRWHGVSWWPPHRFFRFRAQPAVAAVAEETRPDVIVERYYNFGGEGIATARERGIPGVLAERQDDLFGEGHPPDGEARREALLLGRMDAMTEAGGELHVALN